MTTPTPPEHRPIRSYVLREGRMTEGQRQAFSRLWPRFGIDYPSEPLDPASLFDQPAPLYLEIGFGNGESLLNMARQHPDRHYLGIEVHRPGVGHLLLELERAGLDNVRVLRHDAMEILEQALPDACLAGLYLFFPDPWPKKKHRKRRIVQEKFLQQAARVIRPGGFIHMATDWEHYAQQMQRLLEDSTAFENSVADGDFAPRAADRTLTRFEQRGRRLGHGVWDLLFLRRTDIS
jgi:tRNA (guanine-N7-)-methyltransferase